jgi:hypothetical protein
VTCASGDFNGSTSTFSRNHERVLRHDAILGTRMKQRHLRPAAAPARNMPIRWIVERSNQTPGRTAAALIHRRMNCRCWFYRGGQRASA